MAEGASVLLRSRCSKNVKTQFMSELGFYSGQDQKSVKDFPAIHKYLKRAEKRH